MGKTIFGHIKNIWKIGNLSKERKHINNIMFVLNDIDVYFDYRNIISAKMAWFKHFNFG